MQYIHRERLKLLLVKPCIVLIRLSSSSNLPAAAEQAALVRTPKFLSCSPESFMSIVPKLSQPPHMVLLCLVVKILSLSCNMMPLPKFFFTPNSVYCVGLLHEEKLVRGQKDFNSIPLEGTPLALPP